MILPSGVFHEGLNLGENSALAWIIAYPVWLEEVFDRKNEMIARCLFADIQRNAAE